MDKYVPQEQLVRFVADLVESAKLRSFVSSCSGRGSAAYPPAMMLAVPLFVYGKDMFSSWNLHEALNFGDQELCAPRDNEFQTGLSAIPHVDGQTCSGVQFAAEIADQSFPRVQPIPPFELPEATGGVSPIACTLAPALPTGWNLDSATRTTISGMSSTVT